MTSLKAYYQQYGLYTLLYDQINLASPSVAYSWRRSKKLLQDEAEKLIRQGVSAVADFGCGNGSLLLRLAYHFRRTKAKFIGYDISRDFVDFARKAAAYKKLTNTKFTLLDTEKEKITQKFDLIISSETLEHLQKPTVFLKKAYSSLKPGGYFLLSTPNSDNWIKYPFMPFKKLLNQRNESEFKKYLNPQEQLHKLAESEQHLYVYSHQELKRELQSIGFRVYRSPRSSLVFGGTFFDDSPFFFSLLILADSFFDLIGLPQFGWNNIFFCQKP